MDQLELLLKSREINQTMTRLMLQNGGLDDLVQLMARLLQRAVCVEDTAYYIIADAEFGEMDVARRQSVHLGRTAAELTAELIDRGVYRRVQQGQVPLFVPPIPEIGLTLGRVIAPIVIDRVTHGFLWIIAERPLTTTYPQLVIEQGLTAAALIMLKEKAAREARNALMGDFFASLLHPLQHPQQLEQQARRLNYRLDQPRQVLLIHGVPTDSGSQQSFSHAVDNWLAEQRLNGLRVWQNNQLVLLLPSRDAEVGIRHAQQLLADLHHPLWQLLVGVGEAYVEAGAEQMRQSYAEAQEAIAIARQQGQQQGIRPFRDLGLFHWLYHLSPQQRRNNGYTGYIHRLQQYDAAHNTALLPTLTAYLAQGGSLAAAAQLLHVHRNTLVKRIQRIEQLCQLDLRQPLVWLNLYVALLAVQLHEGKPPLPEGG